MKFGIIVSLITLSITTTWGDDKHCTSKTMSAGGFFEALASWDKKLAEKKENLAVPTLEFTKPFTMPSKYNESSKSFSRKSVYLNEIINGCTITTHIKDEKSPANTHITLAKGLKRTFKQFEVKSESSTYTRGFDTSTIKYLTLTSGGLKIEIEANSECEAGDVTKALRKMGIHTRFMSPKNDINCTPQFAYKVLTTLDSSKNYLDESTNIDNSNREPKIEQERDQRTIKVEKVKAVGV